jgi:hypothetical protein
VTGSVADKLRGLLAHQIAIVDRRGGSQAPLPAFSGVFARYGMGAGSAG